MGKMKELIGIAEAYESAVNYVAVRDSGVTADEIMDVRLSDDERSKIINGWCTEYNFVRNEFRRFIEANPEYVLVDDIEILAPNGEDTGDCIFATEFVAFCENH